MRVRGPRRPRTATRPLLPFHKLGSPKYEASGIPYPVRDIPSPARDSVERMLEQFRERGSAAY